MKRVAGLDLAKDSIHGCILDPQGLKVEQRFETTLKGLMILHHWLANHQVEWIVMENTGIYTEPVGTSLKLHFRIHVVNAADSKRTNRKKMDPEDAWWLAQLQLAGEIGPNKPIRGSYLPNEIQAELRELTRLKDRYTKQATTQKNRKTKIFARLNVKLPDVFGDNKFTHTALMIYQAIAKGLTFDDLLADLQNVQHSLKGKAKGRLTRQMTFIHRHQEELDCALAQQTVEQMPGTIGSPSSWN
ncbi:MAG: transposase [Candidatus Hodarchaeota archaeon]